MAKIQTSKPTDGELEILQILWQAGPSTVKTVNEKLNEKKEVGYTTTLKILQIMNDKNLVERDENERSHVYKAKLKEMEFKKALLDRMMETAFGGSAAQLVLQALGNSKPSKEELAEIRDYLNKIERERK